RRPLSPLFPYTTLFRSSGELRVWRNDGGSANGSLHVALTGRVSNRGGVGSKVDLRAGSLRQRREISAATPAVAPADVIFGLGARSEEHTSELQSLRHLV